MSILKQDYNVIKNKYHKTDEPFDSIHRMAYHGWDCDSSTGLDDKQMQEGLIELTGRTVETSHAVIKAQAFAYVLDNACIGLDEHDYFFCFYNWSRAIKETTIERWHSEVSKKLSTETIEYLHLKKRNGAINCWLDYDHSIPDWELLLRLGFVGVKKYAQDYRRKLEHKGDLTQKQKDFFYSIQIEYDAIIRLLVRVADYASTQLFTKARKIEKSFRNLSVGRPKTYFDALQMIYIYFMLCESVDSYQVRSLGQGLDDTLYPFYCADLKDGRATEEEIRDYTAYFFMQFSAIGNYWGQPFYLGGIHFDGSTKINQLSYLLLDVYNELGVCNPKIQIKYDSATPENLMKKVLNMIRHGNSSLVVICADNVLRHFADRGIPYERAYDFDIAGCYEFRSRNREMTTAPFYLNILQPVSEVLDEENLAELSNYEDFEAAYFKHLQNTVEGTIHAVNEMEQYLEYINPSVMLSATIKTALEKGEDAFFKGMDYNTTAIVINATASAVDALMVVRELVYEKHMFTILEIKKAMDANWVGYERLRLAVERCTCRYGNKNKVADDCTRRIADYLVSFQGIPNSRGGYYKITIHSARQFIDMGKIMKATPDGRYAGDETSKNASPTAGKDKNGVTSLIASAANMRLAQFTEGGCLDVMLHPSAVDGDNGWKIMKALIEVYAQNDGSAIQFNICNVETLRAAQKTPGKYQNLQIRVCGWNVLFCNMAKSEQDQYILRAESLL